MYILTDKNPCVSRDTSKDPVEGDHECYDIMTDHAAVEELTLNDIIYIHARLGEFIAEAEEKKRKEEPNEQ